LAEIAVLEKNRSSKSFLTCAIRPAGIFGEGDVQVLPPMVKAAKEGQSRFQLGANENMFDFTYVGNVAHAHLLAAAGLLATSKLSITPLDTENIDGEAFFVTNDSPTYFWDFAHSVYREAGATVGVDPATRWNIGANLAITVASLAEWALWPLGKSPNLTKSRVRFSTLTRYYNITKAKQRLGYAPIVSLEEGIKRGVKDVLARDYPQ
jgi:sterol-4alpha-carboxylate 3-dehydrogenase (decarboxylating)